MLRRTKLVAAVCAASLVLSAREAAAQITWNWAFDGNAGQFVTSGSAPGGVAAAGSYDLLDFSVTSSAPGATLGSMSGGQYVANGYSTNLPYTLQWNGSAVTQWTSAGSNTFEWWVFNEVARPNMYFFFGWESTNINTVDHAAYFDANLPLSQPSYPVRVSVAGTSTVPEPATLALVGLGLGALGLVRRYRTRS